MSPSDISRLEYFYSKFYEKSKSILYEIRDKATTISQYYLNSTDNLIVVPEELDSSLISRIEYLTGANADFRGFVIDNIQPTIEAIVGKELNIFKDKCNLKLPGSDGFPPHQDYIAYQHFPPDYNITAMIPIDDMDIENGCVQFAKNYRESAFVNSANVENIASGQRIFDTDDRGGIVAEVVTKIKWQASTPNAGDIVLFDHFIPHFSQANMTQSPRRAYFITFSLAEQGDWYEFYFANKRENYNSPKFHVANPTGNKPSRS